MAEGAISAIRVWKKSILRRRLANLSGEPIIGRRQNGSTGVELVLPQEMKHVTVQAIGSTLGDKRDQGAGRVSIFGVE